MTTRLSRREWLAAAALCSASTHAPAQTAPQRSGSGAYQPLTADSTLGQLVSHPAFAGFGRRILPWDDRALDENARLSAIGSLLPYHSQVDVPSTVAALNRLIEDAGRGWQIFYELYDDKARRADPASRMRGCSSCVASPVRRSRSSPLEAVSPMSAPSMKAFPMPPRSAGPGSTPSS